MPKKFKKNQGNQKQTLKNLLKTNPKTEPENQNNQYRKTEIKTETKEDKPEKAEVKESVKSEDEPKKERSESMTLLQKDRTIVTRSDVDENFKQEIMDAGAETVAICFQCGTCTAACPSGRRTPYRIRQLVRRAAWD